MNEHIEYSFYKELSFLQKLIQVLLGMIGILVILISFLLPIFFMIGFFILMIAYLMKYHYDREIEYLIFDDQLEIDEIIHNRKRKKLYDVNLKEMTALVEYDRESFLKYPKKYRKDFSNLNKQNVYMLLFTHQNENYCLLIQGDDKHLEALKRRLVFKGGLR